MKIEILGTGCRKCEVTERHAREAIAELGLDAQVEHVYDLREFARRGVMFTPAVAIDGEVRVAGHVPGVGELKALLGAAQRRGGPRPDQRAGSGGRPSASSEVRNTR